MKQIFKGIVRILKMPILSPTVKSAKIVRWHGKKGDLLKANELILDVETLTLSSTETLTSVLEVEIQEDMFIASILGRIGQTYPVGTNIAILVEDHEDIDKVLSFEDLLSSSPMSTASTFPQGIEIAMWQAYVKSQENRGCS